MRPRLFSLAACLCLLLVPLSPALADVTATGTSDVTVDRSLLRSLMVQRSNLVASLSAQNPARGQLLTLGALSAADTVLSTDALALGRTIARLSPHPASHPARRPERRDALPAAALLAAPGVLWSPQARPMTMGLPVTSARPAPRAQDAGATSAASLPLPLLPMIGLTPTVLLPLRTAALSGGVSRASHSSPSGTANTRSSSSGAANSDSSSSGTANSDSSSSGSENTDSSSSEAGAAQSSASSVSVNLPPSDAPAHARLMLTGDGSDGDAFSPGVANATVAAAVLVPVAVPRPHVAPPRPQISSLAVAQQRWRVVTAALAYVRALEAWARATTPASDLTTSSIVTSPAALHALIDHWNANPSLPIAPFSSAAPLAAADVALGATVSVSSPVTSTVTAGGNVTGTVGVVDAASAVTGTLAGDGAGATADSLFLDSTSIGATTDTITTAVPVTSLAAITTSTSLTATDLTATGAAGSLPAAVSPFSVTAGASTALGPAAAADGQGALEPAVPVSAAAPLSPGVSLALSVEDGTPVMTVTTALTSATPLTLVVTLPATAAQTLAPPGFLSQRGALESVVRQGQELFARLQASQAAVEQSYQARLHSVVALNQQIQQNWYARWNAYNAYQLYLKRAAAYAAYAHRLHEAGVAYAQWQGRMAAWTRYAQQLAAYRAALAASQATPVAPVVPISGTVVATGTAPPPEAPPLPTPVAPPFPGPKPTPFAEAPPPWPGTQPPAAPNPGPEPQGYALPSPPPAVPPWDGATPPLAILRDVGTDLNSASILGAAGSEVTTQGALLAAGALDGVGSYQDPIKGIITTYFGGSNPFMSYHPAIDIAAPEYTPIHATAGGVVIWAGYELAGQRHYGYGLCVVIRHNAHVESLYAHMDDERYGLQVHVGDVVQQGQVIGYVGLTGWTTGPHLHFEIRVNNIQVNPLLLIPNPQD